MKPREGRIDWTKCYFDQVRIIAQRSPDPNTQVGCILTDNNHRLLSQGYNAFPKGIDQDSFSWARDNKDPLLNKYLFVLHAEQAAILNLAHIQEAQEGICYVTLHPCSNCMKELIQVGIRTIYFIDAPYFDTPENIAARMMLNRVNGHLYDTNGVDNVRY